MKFPQKISPLGGAMKQRQVVAGYLAGFKLCLDSINLSCTVSWISKFIVRLVWLGKLNWLGALRTPGALSEIRDIERCWPKTCSLSWIRHSAVIIDTTQKSVAGGQNPQDEKTNAKRCGPINRPIQAAGHIVNKTIQTQIKLKHS
jgi:hypothetical protein